MTVELQRSTIMTAMTVPPLDLSHHFSYATKNRNLSKIKDFYKYFLIPNIANFAGGIIPGPKINSPIRTR